MWLAASHHPASWRLIIHGGAGVAISPAKIGESNVAKIGRNLRRENILR